MPKRASSLTSSSSSSDDEHHHHHHRHHKKPKDKHKLRVEGEIDEERRRRKEKKKEKHNKDHNNQGEQLIVGYTNESNPFNDINLTDKFVWRLKKEREKEQGISSKESKKKEAERRAQLEQEILKMRERRKQREEEKRLWEEERLRLERERDSLEYADWEKKEAEFHMQQARKRAQIRIAEGRAKPIDRLYMNLNMDFDEELSSPYTLFQGLSLADLEELHRDVLMYLEMDTSHRVFWEALKIVCENELQQAKKREEPSPAFNTGVHPSVNEDIRQFLRGKSSSELDAIQLEINAKLSSGTAHDVEYWETLLKELVIEKAKATLHEIHIALLRKRLELLEQQQQSTQSPATTAMAISNPSAHKLTPEELRQRIALAEQRTTAAPAVTTATAGPAPPRPLTEEERRKRALEEETARLARRSEMARPDRELTEKEFMEIESSRAWGENEETFNEEVPLATPATPTASRNEPRNELNYSANDKYRPRKPKFFNRVRTGYEWNKYNQTHYDQDNPPPKIVQGYKFNIFYPDLLDKTKTPKFFLEKSDEPGTVIIRFHAGPPYEDIAFKIVDREWEYSHKKGYRCSFEKGILQLWFNFKRYRYRR